MDKKTNQIAKKFASKIKKKFRIQKILLFGSRAKGDHFINSDFDFIIVSEDFSKLDFMKRMSEMLKYWNEKQDLEALCYTPIEFKKKSKEIGIVKEAVRTGREV